MTRHGHGGSALRSIATLARVLLVYYGVALDWGAGAGRVADVIGRVLFIVGGQVIALLVPSLPGGPHGADEIRLLCSNPPLRSWSWLTATAHPAAASFLR